MPASRATACLDRAAILQDDGLPVAAHVGNEFHAFVRAKQRAPSALLGQCVVIAVVRNRKLVPHIAGPGLEDAFHLALVERFVEVT